MTIDKLPPDPDPRAGKRFPNDWEKLLIKATNDERQKATTDALTGLYNQRYWQEQLPQWEKSGHLAYIIIVLDLNGFKKYNDTYGHYKGDQRLIETGKVIRETFRPEDILIRKGGDEFVEVLKINPKELTTEYQKYLQKTEDHPPAGIDGYITSRLSDRLTANIVSFNEQHPKSPPISISFGLHLSLPDENSLKPHDLNRAFQLADDKMYLMKNQHNGQNGSQP